MMTNENLVAVVIVSAIIIVLLIPNKCEVNVQFDVKPIPVEIKKSEPNPSE